MTLDEIGQYIGQMQRAGLAAVEYEQGGCVLRLRANSSAAPTVRRQTAPAPATVRAPAAGVFRQKHPLAAPPRPASTPVQDGEIVGFLQIGPLLRPVTAGAGMLGDPLFTEGETAGYGTPLFPLTEHKPPG